MGNDLDIKKSSWLDKEEKAIVMKQFFPPNTSDIEMIYCMKVAETFNLNPILKQIYFVPRKSKVDGRWVEKVEPLAGRDSFLTLAHRSKNFAGIESSVSIKETPVLKDGKWSRENDLVATAKVYRTNSERPFEVSVNYREYCQKTKEGIPTKFWKEKPETMLKKVAESQALRKAFDISGLYAEEEYNDEIINVTVDDQKTTGDFDINSLQKNTTTKEPQEQPQAKVNVYDTLLAKLLKQGIGQDKAATFLDNNEKNLEKWMSDEEDFNNAAMELLF
jgi:phage recombination protein Bet